MQTASYRIKTWVANSIPYRDYHNAMHASVNVEQIKYSKINDRLIKQVSEATPRVGLFRLSLKSYSLKSILKQILYP